ncbi:MAG: O-antigen ligase family protein [Bacteroidota bacterium]
MNPSYWNERTASIAIAGILSVVFGAALWLSGGTTQSIVAFPLIALFLFLLTSFELALFGIIVCLFVDVHVSVFSSAVWYSLFLLLAFVLHHPEFSWRRFANPLTIPLLVYGACIIPSLTNAFQPTESILKLFNVVGFLIAFYVFVAAVNSRERMRKAVTVFLVLAFANALHVFVQAILGQPRPFGFAGVMFVDYAGMGITATAVMGILSRGRARLAHFLVSGVLAVALLASQTRSIWLATAITLTLVGLSIVLKPSVWGMSRPYALGVVVAGVLVLAAAGALTVLWSPRVEERALEVANIDPSAVSDEGVIRNSLVTRALIWDTALNAFRAHPYVGVGVYGFPYSSIHYARMPRMLYTRYVEMMSPHQTHLAVLSETGVIGALGFGWFLVAALRAAVRAVRSASGIRARKFAIVAAGALIYCMVSMVFTDAWLWGQGIVLLGIIAAMVVANGKMEAIQVDSAVPH